jgi:hypothetical protein
MNERIGFSYGKAYSFYFFILMQAIFSPFTLIYILCKVAQEGGNTGMNNNFFKNIESKTGVNMKDIFDLANSLQNANFKDEGRHSSSIPNCWKTSSKRNRR